MGEVQRTGVGSRTALAVLIEQHMPGQLELVVQFVQGAQPDADAVLIQERHLLRVGELDAGDIPAHPGGIQRR